ncbi:MAG TPA: hypothetical protein DDY91_13250 [Planctomycetaceae bacterium]|nr:hypothetical protein [Planctomycetaceae bacterium]
MGLESIEFVASLRRRRSAPRSAPTKCPDTAHLFRTIGLFVVFCQVCRPMATANRMAAQSGFLRDPGNFFQPEKFPRPKTFFCSKIAERLGIS